MIEIATINYMNILYMQGWFERVMKLYRRCNIFLNLILEYFLIFQVTAFIPLYFKFFINIFIYGLSTELRWHKSLGMFFYGIVKDS